MERKRTRYKVDKMNYEVYKKLKNLYKKHGDKEFGRICQILLELTLQELKYKTRGRNVERPDIIAVRDTVTFSIECKVPFGSYFNLSKRDLDGIKNVKNAIPIIATLLVNSTPNWIFAKAIKLKVGKHNKFSLKSYDQKEISKKINNTFPKILERHYDIILKRGCEGIISKVKN